MAEIDTTYKDTGIVDEIPSPTSQSSFFHLGYSDGERWSKTDACPMEHKHLVSFVRSEAGTALKSSDAPCDRLAHELFFALLGIIGDDDAANNLDEANAFWQSFCPNALTNLDALQGFIEGALTVSDHAVQQFPCSSYTCEQAWNGAVQDADYDVWIAGISWTFGSATNEELANVRAFVDGRDPDWPASDCKERLLAFSTFSRCERVYFAIAGGDKDKNAAHKFWAARCPELLQRDSDVECFLLGVCFAMHWLPPLPPVSATPCSDQQPGRVSQSTETCWFSALHAMLSTSPVTADDPVVV